MAKTLVIIQLELAEAKKQANCLDQISRELKQTAKYDLETVLKGIESVWKSDTAFAYIKKGRVLQEELEKRADELKNIANTIRLIAKNTYEAEMNAYRIALTRKYK